MRSAALAPVLVLALWLLGGGAFPAVAGASPPGASSCTGCHAPVARTGAVPPIAGQPADAMATALRDFRSGARPATVMDRIARGFTEAELDALAAHFATQSP